MGFVVLAVGGSTLSGGRWGHRHALQALHRSPSSWVPRGLPCHPGPPGREPPAAVPSYGDGENMPAPGQEADQHFLPHWLQAASWGIIWENNGPSSLSSRSRQATLSDAEAQPVKSPELCQPSSPCPALDSGWRRGMLLSPHHAPKIDVAATVRTCLSQESEHRAPGKFPAVSEADRWTA